jgi:hypothetical protein
MADVRALTTRPGRALAQSIRESGGWAERPLGRGRAASPRSFTFRSVTPCDEMRGHSGYRRRTHKAKPSRDSVPRGRYTRFEAGFAVLYSVGPGGFEPPTHGLRVRCSTRLSYEPKSFTFAYIPYYGSHLWFSIRPLAPRAPMAFHGGFTPRRHACSEGGRDVRHRR